MRITIANTYPSNDPEVHKAGCADVARGIKRLKYQGTPYSFDADSQTEVAAEYWADILAEEDDATADEYRAYTKFLPCTKGLPR